MPHAVWCIGGGSTAFFPPMNLTPSFLQSAGAAAVPCAGASHSQIINKNGATSGFEMCFAIESQHLWIPAPLEPGLPTKTRLESRFCNKEALMLPFYLRLPRLCFRPAMGDPEGESTPPRSPLFRRSNPHCLFYEVVSVIR